MRARAEKKCVGGMVLKTNLQAALGDTTPRVAELRPFPPRPLVHEIWYAFPHSKTPFTAARLVPPKLGEFEPNERHARCHAPVSDWLENLKIRPVIG